MNRTWTRVTIPTYLCVIIPFKTSINFKWTNKPYFIQGLLVCLKNVRIMHTQNNLKNYLAIKFKKGAHAMPMSFLILNTKHNELVKHVAIINFPSKFL